MSVANGPERKRRVEAIFKPGRLAFIPYIMAGDPDLETTQAIIGALGAAGADTIELGVPYSDPLADGPTIAAAGTRALNNGTSLSDVLNLVRHVHAAAPPIILFTYYNPIYQRGLKQFAREAANAGAAGAIVPDLTLEEAGELREALSAEGLVMPLLIAPSTPRERAARIAEGSGGFVYVVSRFGVTGAGKAPDFAPLRDQIAMVRSVTDKPLAVGFGISSAAHVRAVRDVVDGVIVGSALIDAYANTRGEEAARRAGEYLTSIR